jgi:hypothetical protein
VKKNFGPWLFYHPAVQNQRGVKKRGAVIIPAATVASGRKKSQIYMIKLAQKMRSSKLHCEDVVSGDENTTSRLKFKNSVRKGDLNKKINMMR